MQRQILIFVLDGDPAKDVVALGKVRYTIRGGKVIYSAPASK